MNKKEKILLNLIILIFASLAIDMWFQKNNETEYIAIGCLAHLVGLWMFGYIKKTYLSLLSGIILPIICISIAYLCATNIHNGIPSILFVLTTLCVFPARLHYEESYQNSIQCDYS